VFLKYGIRGSLASMTLQQSLTSFPTVARRPVANPRACPDCARLLWVPALQPGPQATNNEARPRPPKATTVVDKPLINLKSRKESNAHFVAPGFHFLAPDFHFLVPDFDFLAPGFHLLAPGFDFLASASKPPARQAAPPEASELQCFRKRRAQAIETIRSSTATARLALSLGRRSGVRTCKGCR
jgi:hypothetical protein